METTTARPCLLAQADPRRCAGCGARLPANRRRFCDRTCARAWSDNHVWSSARLAALERDGYRCRVCDRDALVLHVHHVEPVFDYSSNHHGHHLDGLITLCEEHHRAEHSFSREIERWLQWADGTVSRQLELPLAS